MQPSLSLSLPRKTTQAAALGITPRQTQEWLASLPLANAAEAGRKLHLSLCTLNRAEMPPIERLETLRHYESPVESLTTSLRAQLRHLSLPLLSKQRQLAHFLTQLNQEMAHGFKHVLAEHADGRARLKPDTFAAAAERALFYLSQTVLQAYHVYDACPAGAWLEAHAIYGYFEAAWAGLPGAPADRTAKVSQRYKQLLVLGSSAPYQLPPDECLSLYAFLAKWVERAGLTPVVEIKDAAGHFVVDSTFDAPPVPYPRDVSLQAVPNLRVLALAPLVTLSEQFSARLSRGETPAVLGVNLELGAGAAHDMLRRLVRAWGQSRRRQFSRARREGRLLLCVGLNALHFFADGQRVFLAGSAPSAPEEGVIPGEEGADMSREVIEESFRVSEWRVRDASAGGFAAESKGTAVPPVHVGDVTGVREGAGEWRVGVVRWQKSGDALGLEMGIEMLSPAAEAVAVRRAGAHVAPEDYTQALLLPAMPVLHRPPVLLLRHGTFVAGYPLQVRRRGGEEVMVRPMRLIERTRAFELVTFSEMARAEPGAASGAVE